jgi:hypothetical protein
MNKKKNYKQFGSGCPGDRDTSNYKCDEDDSNCIYNVVDLILRTEFKGNLSEASKYGGITEELESAINSYYEKYEKEIEDTMAPKCSGEKLNFCSFVGCKMRALNNYYLLYKQYGQSRLKQEEAKLNAINATMYGKKSKTWEDYAEIPGWEKK